MLASHSPRSTSGMEAAAQGHAGESWLRRLLDWPSGSVSAVFESRFMLDESVWRLAVATEGRFFNGRPGQAAVGRVSMEGVSLQQITPTSRATMPARYVGAFQEVDGRVQLTGRFSVPVRLQVFTAIWLAFFLVVAAGLAAPALGLLPALPWWLQASGTGLLAAGVGSVAMGRRQAMNDVPRLANVIANALSGTPESFEQAG